MNTLATNLIFQSDKTTWKIPESTNKKFPFNLIQPAISIDHPNSDINEFKDVIIKDNATNFTSEQKDEYIIPLNKPLIFQKVGIVNKQVGIIIPCYNEEKRLKIADFKDFLNQHNQYLLCFVNDGSSDNTISILEKLRKQYHTQVIVIDCLSNLGKAGAVRTGVNYLKTKKFINYIGFLDADLSTDFVDFLTIVDVIKASQFKIVSGSRIVRMGANIVKQSSRGLISKSINFLICLILGMNFQDTQCGAKIMTKDMAENAFRKPFLTRWLFDVEIFMRMKVLYGKTKVNQYICEQPLNRWIHTEDSKLSMKDSFKIVFQLFHITFAYRN